MNTFLQWAILALLALVLFTLVDPFMYWMPSMVQMVALTVAAALLVLFCSFVIAEKGGDEREVQHRMLAGRAAFLSGIVFLTTALLYQGFTHTIDPWIPLSLCAMVFAKLVMRWYAQRSK